SSWIAASTSASSGPWALTRMVAPSSAASIMTPMMLLPFTSRPSRDTMTSDLKRDAVLTNSAQARACSPSWLRIRSWISATDPPRSTVETPRQDQSQEPERERPARRGRPGTLRGQQPHPQSDGERALYRDWRGLASGRQGPCERHAQHDAAEQREPAHRGLE